MKTFLFIAIILLVYAGLVIVVNRFSRPSFGHLPVEGARPTTKPEGTLTAVTWNIGYAALGRRADFIVDGGKSLRVLNRDEIMEGATAIGEHLRSLNADVLLLQEVAGPSFLTRGVDVRGLVEARIQDHARCFWSDFETHLVPPPLKIRHGMMLASRHPINSCEVLHLPQDPKYYYGFLKKYYGGLISRFPIEGRAESWAVLDIHLSAFDENATVRKTQIGTLLELAVAEYEAGNAVVVGGDWNMRLSPTEFPHTTPDEFLFWVFDLPEGLLPEGWRIAVDTTTPTVRTLHKSYVAGENYTTIIDGFLLSPNVIVEELRTSDLGFRHTDHHPVLGRFRLKD